MARYKGEILILFSTIAWGTSYLFIKTAMETLTAFNLVALRFSVAAIVTALVFSKQARGIGRTELLYGGAMGTLLFGSASLLSTGLPSTSVANAGFIIGSMVLFVAILDTAVSRKTPHPGLVIGVLCAIAGIGVLTLRGELAIRSGDLYCLGATLVLALHVMVAQRAAKRTDILGASIVQFATTGVLAWMATLLQGNAVFFPAGSTLVAVLVLGVAGTAFGFICQVAGQKFLSPTRTAFIFTMEPIFATLFAWLFRGEAITWHVYAGGGLLLAGVYISEYRAAAKT